MDNRTGGVVQSITATPCNGSEAQQLTLPDGGIAFSSQATIELPGPGCWVLEWSGDGCTGESPYQTSTDVCGGETYEWTASNRMCDAGGW